MEIGKGAPVDNRGTDGLRVDEMHGLMRLSPDVWSRQRTGILGN